MSIVPVFKALFRFRVARIFGPLLRGQLADRGGVDFLSFMQLKILQLFAVRNPHLTAAALNFLFGSFSFVNSVEIVNTPAVSAGG